MAGADGLVSKKRGRPSNRRYSEDFRNLVLDLVREHYVDFGPTLAAEKLIECHRIAVSKETLRQWMMEASIWVSRRERKKRVFQPRGGTVRNSVRWAMMMKRRESSHGYRERTSGPAPGWT
ncbi:hypothetical protein [Sinorhizobium meliloti]|uniref:hypothetical protein n=1 Tax=Rhizobium meliloti TaxID=382 RepID=UPI0039893F33